MVGHVDMIIGFDFLHTRKYYLVVEAQLLMVVDFYKSFVMFEGNCFFLVAEMVNFVSAESDSDVLQKGCIPLGLF